MHKKIILIATIALLVQFGAAINCYVDYCSDVGTIVKKCSKNVQDFKTENCTPNAICVKHIIVGTTISDDNIELPPITLRGCALENYCEQVGLGAENCYTCKTDLCNSE